MLRVLIQGQLACFCSLFLFSPLSAAEPVHVQIDQLIAAKFAGGQPAAKTSDAEFVRRVYLDLAGRIPTATETRTFLSDTNAKKRETLIDALLASEDYPRRMAELLHVMLLERRGNNEEWSKFLQHAAKENLPWDKLAGHVLHPNADDENTRGAGYFFTSRLVAEGAMAAVDYPAVTRDVGRLFAGIDLQCAQCHDHLSISDYLQKDFQGMHLIFQNLTPRRDVKFPAVSEKVITAKQDYQSVFVQVPMEVGVLVPGAKELEVPKFPKEEMWRVAPDNKTRKPGVPRFSPLEKLAEGLPVKTNEKFMKNAVNRFWFTMMGHGLIMPLDLQHSDNPPSHPELLSLLVKEFAAHNCDIKWLLRELALTDTYQRSSKLVANTTTPPDSSYLVGLEKRLSAEQLFWSVMIATGQWDVAQEKSSDKISLEKAVAENSELKKMQTAFGKAYANPPKEPEIDFEPTVKSALFLLNDETVLELFQPEKHSLVGRLTAINDTEQLIEEMFLTLLSRQPTPEEKQDVLTYLEEQKTNRDQAVRLLCWSLAASTEFIVNH